MVSLTMEIPQLPVDMGDRRPCCAGGASSTGAVVEKSVVLPQPHLVINSLRAAHELSGLLFLRALYTGTGPGGRVHRDTAPHN